MIERQRKLAPNLIAAKKHASAPPTCFDLH